MDTIRPWYWRPPEEFAHDQRVRRNRHECDFARLARPLRRRRRLPVVVQWIALEDAFADGAFPSIWLMWEVMGPSHHAQSARAYDAGRRARILRKHPAWEIFEVTPEEILADPKGVTERLEAALIHAASRKEIMDATVGLARSAPGGWIVRWRPGRRRARRSTVPAVLPG